MSSLRQNIKRLTPQPVWQAGRESWLALHQALGWPLATLHPWRRASLLRLAKLKNAHRGQRAFILGNGPSLARIDVRRLAG